MENNTIIGTILAAGAVLAMCVIVLWSRGIIERIWGKRLSSFRDIEKEITSGNRK